MSRTLYLTDEQHRELLVALANSAIAHDALARNLPKGNESRARIETASAKATELGWLLVNACEVGSP